MTTAVQRIIIWIIAIVMTVGTIGSFALIIIGNENNKAEQARITKLQNDYQAKVDAQTKELSEKYYADFSGYQSRVGSFDATSVKALATEDLKVGDGDALTDQSSFAAYYIGWNPSGKVFDSSISNGALKAPINVTPGGVITGWTEGVVGMKVGGVRELTIPSDKAYGSTGQGSDIAPNTPLKFVIMVVPTPPTIAIPQELLQYYQSRYQ
jgi:FKBP-type peptidyl-prolyl cis-trans isomerase